MMKQPLLVIPAKAGTQPETRNPVWAPAFAGVTNMVAGVTA